MSRLRPQKVRRAPVLAVVATALVAGGLADRAGAPSPPAASQVQEASLGPVAAPAAALSSSWFCAGATDAANGPLSGRVVIANSASTAATGTVTIIGSSGAPVTTPVSVAPRSSAVVAETVPGGSPWVGAIANIDAGSVAVEQVLDGPYGRTESPCVTSGSPHWYFPAGRTLVNADDTILLLNPYPTDSIVDLSFTTNEGQEQPQDFAGVDVPPRGLVALDLRSHLRRRSSIATTVSARTGAVVAWQAQTVSPPAAGQPLVGTPAGQAPLADPALGVAGVSVTPGAPGTGSQWVWPDGLAGDGIDEQYVVYNPGPRTAMLRLSVGLAQGSAEPFSFPVGPYQVVPIISEQQARIPAGMAHSATLVSTNGVPVVAARSVTAAAPSLAGGRRVGLGLMLGLASEATDWLVPAPATSASFRGSVIVYNPGRSAVTVGLDQLAAPGGSGRTGTLGTGSLAAGSRAAVALPVGSAGPVEVRATGPVYVEYDIYAGAGTGVSLSPAVPLAG